MEYPARNKALTGSMLGASIRATRSRLVWAPFALVLAACPAAYIPSTEIPDSEENRDVISFCEQYRRAVEQRDVGALMSLASPGYFEDAGTPGGDDDYNLAGLRQLLAQFPDRVREVRYDIRYRRIRRGSNAHVFVQFTYNASFQIVTAAGERWFRRVADNELELERVSNRWRIVAGM